MIEIASSLLGPLQHYLLVSFVVFLRIGAMLAVLPAFGEQSIPQKIRLALAFAFMAIIAPSVGPLVDIERTTFTETIGYLATEVIIGLALGLALRIFVIVLQVTGTMAAQSTSLSQIFGPSGMEPMPAFGHLMVVGGLALATFAGLHVQVAAAMIMSYDIFPPGEFPDSAIVSQWGIQRISRTFSLAFTLAIPFVIASFIYNLTLGIINKAMPQLMVALVGAPAITAGGLVLLFLSMPAILSVWNNQFQTFLANPFVGN